MEADKNSSCAPIVQNRQENEVDSFSETSKTTDGSLEEKSKKGGYARWTQCENILYLRFLKSNSERMEKKRFLRKYNKFLKMSSFIGSKTSNQCRSHHQKMICKYGSVQGILGSRQQTNKNQEQGFGKLTAETQQEEFKQNKPFPEMLDFFRPQEFQGQDEHVRGGEVELLEIEEPVALEIQNSLLDDAADIFQVISL